MGIRAQISHLPVDHQKALNWYIENNHENEMPFTPKIDGVPLVSPAQGIFKPANSKYAISVKETFKGIYPDQKPHIFPDGSAIYAYHQQGDDSYNDRISKSSNIAIDKNITDKIPLGVLIQTKEKGREGAKYSTYIALPLGWIDGVFILYIAPPNLQLDEQIMSLPLVDLLGLVLEKYQVQSNIENEVFDPSSITDARKKIFRAISQRKGQPKFRAELLAAYNQTCPITGCKVEEALEAAHISPYNGQLTNVVPNGFILRSDIHLLWDKYLITVEAKTHLIKVAPKLRNDPQYGQYQDKKLMLPKQQDAYPSELALEYHNGLCIFL